MSKLKISPGKELLVVGDRVLIKMEKAQDRTTHGLYLPEGVEASEKVNSGYVVKAGPGYLMPSPDTLSQESWDEHQAEPKFIPLQVDEGDYVLYLRKAAIEINFEGEKYLIVPYSAILIIVRENILEKLNGEERHE